MPRVSLVGAGHGGSEDYATLTLWWAAESGVDYGSQIEAQCLGVCGGGTISGTSVNGASVYTASVIYNGMNESALASTSSLSLSAAIDIDSMLIQRSSGNAIILSVDGTHISRCRIINPVASGKCLQVTINMPNSLVSYCVISGGTDVVDNGFNDGTLFNNNIVFGGADKGFEASSGAQEVLITNVFSFDNTGVDYETGQVSITSSASEDATGTAGLTGFTSSELVDFANDDYRTKATSTLATSGTGPEVFIGAFLEAGGGGISVTGDTAAFDFTALAGTVGLTGEILVTGSTASFDYSAISGAIDLTGQLLVAGQTANFDYIALPGTIDLTGEIIVTGSTANFDYTGENGVIELGAVINVVGQTANFDVNGVSAEVSLTGEITIVGDTATFDYVAKSGIVVIGEGQKIGTVTAGFASSTIGVQYKQNTITVNFGE